MVDVVTQQAAAQEQAAVVNAAEATAAAEMAQAAQEAAVQDEPAPVETPSSEKGKDWDDLLNDDEDVPEEQIAEEEIPAVAETPEETPEETPLKETPPAEEVAAAEETPADEVVIPPVEAPQETRTPEEVQKEIEEARKTARESLVESFTWTEEQAEQFEVEPGKVMSEMAANLFLEIYDSVSQGLNSQMPAMVRGIMQQQAAAEQSEQAFYSAWPQLAAPEHRETVDRIAGAYWQQNPNTDSATAVKEIGAQAWVALRLPLEDLMAHTQEVPQVQQPAPVVTPQRVPASAGNAPQSARTPVQQTGNDFEQLANELLNDDNEE